MEAFHDADYAGSITDSTSTSSFGTSHGGNLLTWGSKKQVVVLKRSGELNIE